MGAAEPGKSARRFWRTMALLLYTALAALLLIIAVLPAIRKKRDEVFVEE